MILSRSAFETYLNPLEQFLAFISQGKANACPRPIIALLAAIVPAQKA